MAHDKSRGLLIHIGYHKTATTALQESLFENAVVGFVSPWARERIIADWVQPPALPFQPETTRRTYQRALDRAHQKKLLPVLSHERLSGYPASGGYDSKLIADRLASGFPEAQVLIVIREQKSMLCSWYRQYVLDGGSRPLEKHLNPLQPQVVRMPEFRYAFFEYDRLIRYYYDLFTPEAVLVLPFELLQSVPRRFVRKIVDFAGLQMPAQLPAKKNTSRSLPSVLLQRFVNRLFSTNQLSPEGLVRQAPRLQKAARLAGAAIDRVTSGRVHDRLDRRLKRQVAQIVGDRYAASNRRTSALIGTNLSQHGYAC